MLSESYFTSESVSEGHPDKIADQVSDAILDALLKNDKNSRVACETLVKSGMVLLAGEITTSSWIDIEKITRETIADIGYCDQNAGFDSKSCAVLTAISKQSPDIAIGVDRENERVIGAGDQGTVFGYATNETSVLMPAPITYSHLLMKKQAEIRKKKKISWLRPDAKAQLTFKYIDEKPCKIACVVFSTQHDPDIEMKELKEALMEEIIKPVLPQELLAKDTVFHINPTGKFVIGGPVADCGLTGRKIIVDTYGGSARHGGGAFSGKDPTKVDRSGAYMARYIAKNIVASGIASRCEVQVSYAIGVSDPVSVNINTFGTGIIPDTNISKIVSKIFDLTPKGIINSLSLLDVPIYRKTAAYGHFGRNEHEFTWERTDKASLINSEASC